jgi:hypothetical protein
MRVLVRCCGCCINAGAPFVDGATVVTSAWFRAATAPNNLHRSDGCTSSNNYAAGGGRAVHIPLVWAVAADVGDKPLWRAKRVAVADRLHSGHPGATLTIWRSVAQRGGNRAVD